MTPKSRVNVAVVMLVTFSIALLYLATLVFQSNNPSSIKNEAKDSPVVINLYVDEGEISPLLEGIIESDNVTADDMQKWGDHLGADTGWRRVEVEKGLVIRLRSMRVDVDAFYYKYPGKSDFCVTKINIEPETKISNDRMVITSALNNVESYEYVNGKLTKNIGLVLSEEFKEGACPTPSGNIIFSEKETASLGLIPLYAVRNTYFFPFDHQKLSFEIWIELSMRNQRGDEEFFVLSPEVTVTPTYPNWYTEVYIHNTDLKGANSPEFFGAFDHAIVDLDLQRPLLNRLLVILVLLSALAVIGALGFLKDNGVVVSSVIAIVLGLWGIQNMIVPSDIGKITIIAPTILVLYVILIFVMIVRFIFIYPIRGLFRQETAESKEIEIIDEVEKQPKKKVEKTARMKSSKKKSDENKKRKVM